MEIKLVDQGAAKLIRESANRVGSAGRPIGELALTLINGDMVFLAAPRRSSVYGVGRTIRRRGMRLRSRAGTFEGQTGYYVWAEARP